MISSRRVLWAIPVIYVLMVTADLLAMTYLTLLLTARQASALAVGAVASAFWVCIMIASLAAMRLIDRWGLARCFIGGTLVASLAFAGLAWHENYLGWLAGVCVLGFAVGVSWVAGEAWLAERAPAGKRGVFVGLVETMVGLGTVFGPLLLPLVQQRGASPLGVSLALELLAAALGMLTLSGQPQERIAAPGTGAVAGEVPAWHSIALPLVAVSAIGGVLDAGCWTLLPSIAMRAGFDLTRAAWLATVLGAGVALLPTPFGLWADRSGLRRILLGSWAGLVASSVALLLLAWIGLERASPALWPVGFLLSGMGAVVYSLVTVEIGHRLTGAPLVRGLALLVTAYTAGTAIGPFVGGALYDLGGLAALALSLVVASAAGWAVTWRSIGIQAAAPKLAPAP